MNNTILTQINVNVMIIQLMKPFIFTNKPAMEDTLNP